MYARIQKIKRPNGKIDEYVQIVESYRAHGKVGQKVIANLGNKQVLQKQFLGLVKLLNPSLLKEIESVQPKEMAPYGICFVVHHLFREVGLWEKLDRLLGKGEWADRVGVLVANRLSHPSSEHGLGGWLETQYVVDREGKRYLPLWKQQGRVKVDLGWLGQFYRTLDKLIEQKERIEKELYLGLRDLFHLKVEVVFYDLTSAYFEGSGPAPIAHYGYSRDGKSQNRQVLVGMVMVEGFPIAHHVLRGNLADHQTVRGVIEDLGKRFEVGRIIFVGDRGMVTTEMLNFVEEQQQGYLVGLVRRRREEVMRYLEKVEGAGRECPPGVTASEKNPPPKTWVWEVEADKEGVKVLVVHSQEREAYERAMREKCMKQVEEELKGLKKQVDAGKLKSREKIGYRVAKVLSRHKGHRYFDWRISQEGRFEYFEHPVYLDQEKKIEGKYFIQTQEKNLDAVSAVHRYKELSEVERGFRSLKDVLEMRPIYHQTERRVRAHIFVAALGFLIERILEKKLKAKRVNLSAREALQALNTIGVVEFQTATGQKMGVTAGSSRAREVLHALGIQRAVLPLCPLPSQKQADVVTTSK